MTLILLTRKTRQMKIYIDRYDISIRVTQAGAKLPKTAEVDIIIVYSVASVHNLSLHRKKDKYWKEEPC